MEDDELPPINWDRVEADVRRVIYAFYARDPEARADALEKAAAEIDKFRRRDRRH